jgi:hypothetical protein
VTRNDSEREDGTIRYWREEAQKQEKDSQQAEDGRCTGKIEAVADWVIRRVCHEQGEGQQCGHLPRINTAYL